MATATQLRDERLEARVTADQKELFRKAAEARGVTLSDFVVNSVREAAIAALQEAHLLELTRRDQELFLAALENVEPHDRLRVAAERHGYSRSL